MVGPVGVRRIISRPGYAFFDGFMALLATISRNRLLRQRMDGVLGAEHGLVPGASWDGFQRLVRERPVTAAIIDLAAIPPRPSAEGALFNLRRQFPHLGLVLIVPASVNAAGLFRLGKAGIRNLILMGVDDLEADLTRSMAKARIGSAAALVTRFLSPYLPRRELDIVGLAMDQVHQRWSAEDFASEVGITRPFLSERCKRFGLPSVGHLLLWTRLLHAGHWLQEPGRTGESVGRQLEYSSGAAFRRALRHYTGATPTEVREGGGIRLVFRSFLARTLVVANRDLPRREAWAWRRGTSARGRVPATGAPRPSIQVGEGI